MAEAVDPPHEREHAGASPVTLATHVLDALRALSQIKPVPGKEPAGLGEGR